MTPRTKDLQRNFFEGPQAVDCWSSQGLEFRKRAVVAYWGGRQMKGAFAELTGHGPERPSAEGAGQGELNFSVFLQIAGTFSRREIARSRIPGDFGRSMGLARAGGG